MHRRLSPARAALLFFILLAVFMVACNLSYSTATITNAVTAKDVKGDNFDPVGITDTYPFDHGTFHAVVTIANAPSDTALRAVWTAVDVGSASAPNTKIDETTLKVEGSRNVDFTLSPKSGQWPSGSYKVDLYLNDKLDRTLKFSVEPAPVTPTPTPEPATPTPTNAPPTPTTEATKGGCSPLPAPVLKPSGIVTNVTMARGVLGDAKDPANPTLVFPPEAIFHAIVAIKNAQADTGLKASWFATDVGSAADCNTPIDSTSLSTDGTRNIDFSLTPNDKWPVGSYRVEIYVNNNLDRVVEFTVNANAPGQPTATKTTTRFATTTPAPGEIIGVPTEAPTARPSATRPRATTAPTQPTPTSPPPTAAPSASRCGVIPSGQGGLLVINYYGRELNYTVAGKLYTVPANAQKAIYLPPGNVNYSANIPGVGNAGGTLEIKTGVCFVQSWAAQ